MQSLPSKPSALAKPTLNTKYHVDYSWWERSDEDLRIYQLSHLLPEHREQISQSSENRIIDHIDPVTGEVSQLDELEVALQLAAQNPDFINPHTSLVDSIFRVFIRNNNQPLTPTELEPLTGRSATVILKTLSGARIYKGIRPYQAQEAE